MDDEGDLTILPARVINRIVKYLDLETLTACCCSCEEWYKYLSGNEGIWRKACRRFGVKQTYFPVPEEWGSWREYALLIVERLKKMRTSECFRESPASIKVKPLHTFKALYYYKNRLAIATGNRIEMWCITSNRLLFVIVNPRGSAIPFHGSTVRFDDLQIMIGDDFHIIRCFGVSSQREEAVYGSKHHGLTSYDYDRRCDMLVGRKVRGTIQIYKLSTAELVKTIRLHHLVRTTHVKIVFIRSPSAGERGLLYLLSLDKYCLFMWTVTFGDDITFEGGIECSNDETKLTINAPRWYLKEPRLLARPLSHGSLLYYSEPHYCAKTGRPSCVINELDLSSMKILRKIKLEEKIIKDLLAVGEAYIAVHTVGEDGDDERVYVIEKARSTLLALYRLPDDVDVKRRGNRGTAIFCEGNWLDGLDLTNDKGIFLAYVRDNKKVHFAEWIPRNESAA